MTGGGPTGLFLAMLVAWAGCAAPWREARILEPGSESGRGWQSLVEGEPARADSDFARALAKDPIDAAALFGAANLAFERGDDTTALGHSLALLECACKGKNGRAVALSGAILAWLPRLLFEIPDRTPYEDRLLALDPTHLPWQAQYALIRIVIDIARKRADETLLRREVALAGCISEWKFAGTGGRLPYLDLDGENVASVAEAPGLLATACQLQINAADNRAEVKVLRAELDLGQGPHDLVLDFAGPARLRIDRGVWHGHGDSRDVVGPRWSAMRVDLPAGRHTVEVRIGTYGSASELALVVVPAGGDPLALHGNPGTAESALADLSAALVANMTGDWDGLLQCIARLKDRPRFFLGLAMAGRLGEADPTRPSEIMRDKARLLFLQALASDANLARVWLDLASMEMQKERPREAAENARRAQSAAPAWWPAHLSLAGALRSQGLERDADAALSEGLKLVAQGRGGCPMIERGLQRAEDRDDFAGAARLVDLLAKCDAQSESPRAWFRRRGDLARVESLLRRGLATSADPLWGRTELADLRLAQGDPQAALKEYTQLAQLLPRDSHLRIRQADALVAAGLPGQARTVLGDAAQRFPGRQDIRQAARLAGLPVAMDEFRVDGGQVVRDFVASGRRYEAPAAVVLDRAVERVTDDGTRLILTHTITQVLSKDAIENVGEVHVPASAEVLALRTRKKDGSLREAEEIAGKASISAPDLAVGDFVEVETLEVHEPREAFAPGFVGERFYFQSLEAPLDRSEYVLVVPHSMALDINRRAGGPAPVESVGRLGTRILSFALHNQPQVFPERSAVPAPEWVPSVRASNRATLPAWSRFLADRLVRVFRGSPELREVAADIARKSGGDRTHLPEAIVAWVREHIEPEADFWDTATATLARSHGNRAGLMVALARELGVPVDLVLARSLLLAEASAPLLAQELDDFHDLFVRFPSSGSGDDHFVDPRLRRAPFAYVLPAFVGAPAVVIGTTGLVKLSTAVKDLRSVSMRADLALDGSATVTVTEQLSGWPAVEWAEILDRVGKDRSKLRQEFEERWLGQHFPGARLGDLSVDAADRDLSTRVRYTFQSASLAARQGSVLRLRPGFFQTQPGRRYGSEAERKTTLLIGNEVPLDMDAEILLPRGAQVLELGQGGAVVAGKMGELRLSEDRQLREGLATPAGAKDLRILLRRQSRLPILRVLPAAYSDLAVKLRAFDPLEQGEIRIGVPAR